jgi:hypothetical protein
MGEQGGLVISLLYRYILDVDSVKKIVAGGLQGVICSVESNLQTPDLGGSFVKPSQ